MDVKEWMNYECSDEGTHTQNICNSSTRSHALEEENRSKNSMCKWVLILHRYIPLSSVVFKHLFLVVLVKNVERVIKRQ
jgi:hypothetical protein